MDLGFFTIDFQPFFDFLNGHSPSELVIYIMAVFGWIPLAYYFLYALIHLWEHYKEHNYMHHWRWVVLAVDVPYLNVQTPKAVEQMFAHLAGAYDKPNIAGIFRNGYKQRWFSFEIISIGGYIQFLIRTEETFRDLVEAAIYAQYPEAEIVEVEDYVDTVPKRFPNDTHDMWGAEFTLTENEAYPIRTYREFEHNISKDTVLKDPMGAFLESFSRIGPGEQMWFQIIIEPTGSSWKKKSIEKIKEIIGENVKHHDNSILDSITNAPLRMLEGIGDQVFNREAGSHGHHEEAASGALNKIQYLTPGQKRIIEDMEAKIAKVGFKTKMRGVYIARKEVFRPSRGVNALIGAITQYNNPTANSLSPTFTVSASYLYAKKRIAFRKNLIMDAYHKRKLKTGKNPFMMNIEELATVWHFPMSHVKTPLVQKTTTKQAEPPASLPIEQIFAPPTLPFEAEMPTVPGETDGVVAESKKYRTDAGDVGYPKDSSLG